MKRCPQIIASNPTGIGYLGFVYAAAGKKAEAQRVLDQWKALSKQRHVPPDIVSENPVKHPGIVQSGTADVFDTSEPQLQACEPLRCKLIIRL